MSKVLVLKTVDEKMRAYQDFTWSWFGPMKCQDWDPKPECGNGFHGFLWGEGDMRFLTYPNGIWLVLEVDENKIVDLDGKVKFPECEVVAYGDMNQTAKVILERKPDVCCPGSGKPYVYKGKNGITIFYLDGKYHREDGPAYISDNTKYWYRNGLLHNENGPAAEIFGSLFWYENGTYIK